MQSVLPSVVFTKVALRGWSADGALAALLGVTGTPSLVLFRGRFNGHHRVVARLEPASTALGMANFIRNTTGHSAVGDPLQGAPSQNNDSGLKSATDLLPAIETHTAIGASQARCRLPGS